MFTNVCGAEIRPKSRIYKLWTFLPYGTLPAPKGGDLPSSSGLLLHDDSLGLSTRLSLAKNSCNREFYGNESHTQMPTETRQTCVPVRQARHKIIGNGGEEHGNTLPALSKWAGCS